MTWYVAFPHELSKIALRLRSSFSGMPLAAKNCSSRSCYITHSSLAWSYSSRGRRQVAHLMRFCLVLFRHPCRQICENSNGQSYILSTLQYRYSPTCLVPDFTRMSTYSYSPILQKVRPFFQHTGTAHPEQTDTNTKTTLSLKRFQSVRSPVCECECR